MTTRSFVLCAGHCQEVYFSTTSWRRRWYRLQLVIRSPNSIGSPKTTIFPLQILKIKNFIDVYYRYTNPCKLRWGCTVPFLKNGSVSLSQNLIKGTDSSYLTILLVRYCNSLYGRRDDVFVTLPDQNRLQKGLRTRRPKIKLHI